MEHWIKVCKSTRVDLVDFGPPDRDQMHVLISEPSTALVKSRLRLNPALGVTRGELWTSRSNGKIQGGSGPILWNCGPLITHYMASFEPFKLLKRNGRFGYQAGILL